VLRRRLVETEAQEAAQRLIDLEAHRAVFTWILQVLATADLIKGKTIGVDATPSKRTRPCAAWCGVSRVRRMRSF
jgi:hypothetical protein